MNDCMEGTSSDNRSSSSKKTGKKDWTKKSKNYFENPLYGFNDLDKNYINDFAADTGPSIPSYSPERDDKNKGIANPLYDGVFEDL